MWPRIRRPGEGGKLLSYDKQKVTVESRETGTGILRWRGPDRGPEGPRPFVTGAFCQKERGHWKRLMLLMEY